MIELFNGVRQLRWQHRSPIHCGCSIDVRANIHLGGQTEFCPNGERKLFVTRPRQGENNNNELLQSLFFDGRRVVPDERILCYPTRNVSQQTTRC